MFKYDCSIVTGIFQARLSSLFSFYTASFSVLNVLSTKTNSCMYSKTVIKRIRLVVQASLWVRWLRRTHRKMSEDTYCNSCIYSKIKQRGLSLVVQALLWRWLRRIHCKMSEDTYCKMSKDTRYTISEDMCCKMSEDVL